MLNEKIKKIPPSATLKITALAKQMIKQGEDVVNFGAGEPDFDTPNNIKQKAIESIKDGLTKYTPASGIPELKSAIVKKFKEEYNLDFSLENVCINCGAKHSLFNVMQVMLNPGDEVILFAPYWVSYLEQVKLADGVPVIVDTIKSDFKINFEELEKKITNKTKLIIINSPQNPTGVVYSYDELNKLAEIVSKYDNLYIISDEIYEKIIFDNEKFINISSTENGKKILNKILIVNGVSKSYAMTGWRIGYIVGPAEVIKAISILQSHSTSNPTTFCQTASIVALESDENDIIKRCKIFEKRRDLIYNLLSEIKGLKIFKTKGTFYIFPDLSTIINKKYNEIQITDSVVFAELLLKNKKVAVIPGVAFSAPNFIRLSFATSEENIKKGIKRIKEFINELN